MLLKSGQQIRFNLLRAENPRNCRCISSYLKSSWQIEEVYNINETAVAQLGKYTFIAENFVPKKLSINRGDIRELSGHPYISYELAKAILDHRKTYGKFTSLEDLKEVHLVDDQLLGRLSPYLTI